MKALIGIVAAGFFAGLCASNSAHAQASACNRQCLEGFVDRYLDALVKHDPKAVPLAANVRFTENGQRLTIGDGLWRSMKAKGTYRLFVSDVDAGQVAFIGTLDEENADPAKGTPALIALRLRIASDQISEIEQEVVRNVEAANRVAALGAPHPLFTQAIPEKERMSRADLIRTANMYFTGMQQNDGKGEYPFAADCNRIENGMQTTNRPTPGRSNAAGSGHRFELLGRVGLPRAVQIGIAAFRDAHSRSALRGRRSGARPRVQLRVLRSLGRRHAQLQGAGRPQRDGRSRAALDVVHRRVVSRGERHSFGRSKRCSIACRTA